MISPVGGIEIDKFQYNSGISIDQKIFDGGMINIRKQVQAIESDISNNEIELELYKLNTLVNSYFYGILKLHESLKIAQLKRETLQKREEALISGVENGVVQKSELNRIESEILITDQQITVLDGQIDKLKGSFSVHLGIKPEKLQLSVPNYISPGDSVFRYEHKIFHNNKEYIAAVEKMHSKRYFPRVYSYGQVGYSYPGLNIFENEPAGYYIVGLKMSWNIFDWNQGKKDKQLLQLKDKKIDIQETGFNRRLQIETENQKKEIQILENMLIKDETIIQKKQLIAKSSASALDNGTITTADYLNDLNAELKARSDYESHRIMLSEAKSNLLISMGYNIK